MIPNLWNYGFRLYRLRHRGRRDVSGLARPADDGPLGHRRPCRGRGNRSIQKEAAFVLAARYLGNRIMIFINLPIRSLDRMALNAKLREIGRLEGATKP